MHIHPTLYFPGLCHEAIAFYQAALGAEVLFVRTLFNSIDAPPPGTPDKVLRAALRVGEAVIYLSEGHGAPQPGFHNVSLALSLPTLAEATRCMQALAEGGSVKLAQRPTAWAGTYGVVVDRFGLHWSIETAELAPA